MVRSLQAALPSPTFSHAPFLCMQLFRLPGSGCVRNFRTKPCSAPLRVVHTLIGCAPIGEQVWPHVWHRHRRRIPRHACRQVRPYPLLHS